MSNAMQSRIDWIRDHVNARVMAADDSRKVEALERLATAELHAEIAEHALDQAVAALDRDDTEPLGPGVTIREPEKPADQRMTLEITRTY